MLVEVHQQQAARVEGAELAAVALLGREGLVHVLEDALVVVGASHHQPALAEQAQARNLAPVTQVAGGHGMQVVRPITCQPSRPGMCARSAASGAAR
ncbi:MAG TPA: hypothetical protein PLF63_05135 [Rubrivivax sp.]|nr:hypothetical protein [Rubrivivax sp.]